MRSNLLKKEIEFISTKDLNIRYCFILDRAEKLEAKDIPIADARKILWIEDEMRKRTIKAVGHDFYPPDRIEEKYPSNYMISLLKRKPVEPEIKVGIKIKFKITVISSIGSKVAEKTVQVDTMSEANLLATKMIRDLGLKKATYKIS